MNKVAALRAGIKYVKDLYGDEPLIGAEIGVYKGDHAQSILNNLNIKCLYLIDIWDDYRKRESETWRNGDGEKVSGDEIYKEVIEKYAKDHRVKLLRYKSDCACLKLKKENITLDFCYIDGSHERRQVVLDLDWAHNIVKAGGVIAGHDYNDGRVCSAVTAFADYNKLKVKTDGTDYWMLNANF